MLLWMLPAGRPSIWSKNDFGIVDGGVVKKRVRVMAVCPIDEVCPGAERPLTPILTLVYQSQNAIDLEFVADRAVIARTLWHTCVRVTQLLDLLKLALDV